MISQDVVISFNFIRYKYQIHRNIRGMSDRDVSNPNLISESIWPIHRTMQCCAWAVFFTQRYVFSTLPIATCPVLVFFCFVLLIYIIWLVLHFFTTRRLCWRSRYCFQRRLSLCACPACLSVCSKKWKTAENWRYKYAFFGPRINYISVPFD